MKDSLFVIFPSSLTLFVKVNAALKVPYLIFKVNVEGLLIDQNLCDSLQFHLITLFAPGRQKLGLNSTRIMSNLSGS